MKNLLNTIFNVIDNNLIDDYGLAHLSRDQRHDLLEILEDRMESSPP